MHIWTVFFLSTIGMQPQYLSKKEKPDELLVSINKFIGKATLLTPHIKGSAFWVTAQGVIVAQCIGLAGRVSLFYKSCRARFFGVLAIAHRYPSRPAVSRINSRCFLIQILCEPLTLWLNRITVLLSLRSADFWTISAYKIQLTGFARVRVTLRFQVLAWPIQSLYASEILDRQYDDYKLTQISPLTSTSRSSSHHTYIHSHILHLQLR